MRYTAVTMTLNIIYDKNIKNYSSNNRNNDFVYFPLNFYMLPWRIANNAKMYLRQCCLSSEPSSQSSSSSHTHTSGIHSPSLKHWKWLSSHVTWAVGTHTEHFIIAYASGPLHFWEKFCTLYCHAFTFETLSKYLVIKLCFLSNISEYFFHN